jgi:predicted Rdx family selenoprotein
VKGSGGIFEIAVDGVVICKKGPLGFPTEKDIVDAVSKVLGP